MQLPGTRVTPDGRIWLESTRTARPLHIFSQVVNLSNERGEILALSTEVVGLGPFALSVPQAQGFSFDEPGFQDFVADGQEVEVRAGLLHLGRMQVDWQQAQLWDPRPAWSELRARQTEWRDQLGTLRALLAEAAPPGGLAALLQEDPQAGSDSGMAGAIVAAARQPARDLLEALAAEEPYALAESAAALAGLGGGLTPSGDDYLIGTMHALWATRPEAEARSLAKPMAHAAVSRTNEISGAWIAAAAKGEAAEYWHKVFAALLAPGELDLEAPVRALLQVGHTSGADALAGFVACLQSF